MPLVFARIIRSRYVSNVPAIASSTHPVATRLIFLLSQRRRQRSFAAIFLRANNVVSIVVMLVASSLLRRVISIYCMLQIEWRSWGLFARVRATFLCKIHAPLLSAKSFGMLRRLTCRSAIKHNVKIRIESKQTIINNKDLLYKVIIENLLVTYWRVCLTRKTSSQQVKRVRYDRR
jgi:hypothetical protein